MRKLRIFFSYLLSFFKGLSQAYEREEIRALHKEHLTFEPVRTPEQFAMLEKFAAGFDHKIMTKRHPITLIKRGSKPIAYFATSFDPLAMFAWHTDPAICSPRDVVEAISGVRIWARLQHGGGFCITPFDNTKFTPETMAKLGFSDTKSRLFEMAT